MNNIKWINDCGYWEGRVEGDPDADLAVEPWEGHSRAYEWSVEIDSPGLPKLRARDWVFSDADAAKRLCEAWYARLRATASHFTAPISEGL